MLVIINGNRQPEGSLRDFVTVPYVYGSNTILAHLNTNYYHIHGESFVYPRLANSVTLTSGAGVWNNTGTIVEIIPANILTKDFDLHWLNVFNISGNCEGLIELFTGSAGNEVLINPTWGIKIFRNAVISVEGSKRIQVPQILKNTRISARFSDNTAGTTTVQVSLEGHYYG